MSKREDIRDGRVQNNILKKFGLIYTCNAGWIDLGHLNPNNTRPEIGAANLWKAVSVEGERIKHPLCDDYSQTFMRKGALPSAPAKKPAFCETNPYLSFPDGVTGYRIRYRQDHGSYPFKPGREGIYLVKHGLSVEEKNPSHWLFLWRFHLNLKRFKQC